jgi:hypothetical protein
MKHSKQRNSQKGTSTNNKLLNIMVLQLIINNSLQRPLIHTLLQELRILKPQIEKPIIHLVVCLTTGPKPLPKQALHIVRSRASSFKWEYPLLSLRSSNSFLHLLPCLPLTSIPPSIFPSITRCRRQFLRKMWPIQFTCCLRISFRIFLYSLTLSNTS